MVRIVEMYNFVSEGPTLRWISKSGGLWCSQLGLGLREGLCLSRRRAGVKKKPKKIETVWHGFRGILKLSGRVNQASLKLCAGFSNTVCWTQGSLKVVISVYPYLQKTPNFSRFYKKLGPFYKKLRCDKLGN